MSFSNQITLSNVIFILSLGVMFMILVVIFGKRQIARFKYKSRNVPHIDISECIPKALKYEIQARLRRVLQIRYQPKLVTPSLVMSIEKNFKKGKCTHLYRMKAMDEAKALYEAFEKRHNIRYEPSLLVQDFLNNQMLYLNLDRSAVESFILAYNHARYGHRAFDSDEFKKYMEYLRVMIKEVMKAPLRPIETGVVYKGDGTSGALKQTVMV